MWGGLTSAPIVAQASRKLDSYFVAASVDFARVDREAVQVDVYYTHLASDIDNITYGGAFGSWKEEQLEQMRQPLAFVDETSDGSRPVVVLGDLNTGPSEWPEYFQELLAAGFVKPADVEGDAACTLCPDNSFRSPDSSPTSWTTSCSAAPNPPRRRASCASESRSRSEGSRSSRTTPIITACGWICRLAVRRREPWFDVLGGGRTLVELSVRPR